MKHAVYGLALLAGIGAGCASAPPASQPAPVSEPAPGAQPGQGAQPARQANLNLSGFPVAYREGYAAGCDGSRRREETRYKSDMNYKMGWDDASSICAKRR